MFSSGVEPLHEAQVGQGARHRFDLVALKVNFDRLKDRRKKTFGTFCLKSTRKKESIL